MAEKKDKKTDDNELNEDLKAQEPIGGARAPGDKDFWNYTKIRFNDPNKPDRIKKYKKYSKDDITRYLTDPKGFQDELREASIYIYTTSTHYYRIIQYFVGLTDLAYVVSPTRIDPRTANKKAVGSNYRKVLKLLSSMSIKSQVPSILTVCMREDTYYGTMWVNDDSIIFQQLPFEYCRISTVQDNVFNVSFDFTYFDRYPDMLNYYPPEFRIKYERYKEHKRDKWLELDAPTSFAIKANRDIMDYSVPPLAGILSEIYDIEDYKNLKLTKTALENYAMVWMELPMDDDGNWMIDFKKAEKFWRNLDDVLPEEVGSVLTPMPLEKISFEKSNTGDVDTISEAEENLFTSAGVSSLLFNNENASSNSLLLSIKADQSITYGIVKSVEDMINRFIHSYRFGKNFKVTFLDCSPYNRDTMGDQYLKACQYGIPMVSYYAASQGLDQSELDCMNFLESDVLNLQEIFKPLLSSTNSSTEAILGENEGGAPEKDAEDLSDNGERAREAGGDWN